MFKMPKYLLLGFQSFFKSLINFLWSYSRCCEQCYSVETSVYKFFLKGHFKTWHFQDENCNSLKCDNHSLQFAVVLKAAIIADMPFFSATSRTIPAEEVVCKHTELKSSLHIQWYVTIQKH